MLHTANPVIKHKAGIHDAGFLLIFNPNIPDTDY